MTNIIVVFPKMENAVNIKNVLIRSGYSVLAACTTGSQAIGLADDLTSGIIVCGYRMVDMLYSELRDCLPVGIEMLLMASPQYLEEADRRYGVVCLSMPLKVHELVNTVEMMCQSVQRRRRKMRSVPRERTAEENNIISEAKRLLMTRNHMKEEEAYRYIQKCSMDNSTSLVETAKMILTVMRS